jgi:pimeloyl-ACP methyl ester carboxylesterase
MTDHSSIPKIDLVVPPPLSRFDLSTRDGAIICLRQYGRPGKQRLVLSHGNGLAINAYLPFWELLLDDFELILFDVRNHGENPLHLASHHTWEHMTQDIEDIYRAIQSVFGEAPTVGVFHSLSAILAINHLFTFGPRWSALALYDPPIMPPEGQPTREAQLKSMRELSRRAAHRQMFYASPEDFARQLAPHAAFKGWVPGSHLLFARSTLRLKRNGRWGLCYPRQLESDVFLTNSDDKFWSYFASFPVPGILIAADPDHPHASPPSAICRAIHEQFGFPYAMIPGTTHFLQIEQPELCKKALCTFLDSLQAGKGSASAR